MNDPAAGECSGGRIPVLMAGVVPPPLHGQSLLVRALFDADLDPIEKVLVEIRSSREISQVGRPSIGKLFGVVGLIAEILRKRFTRGPEVFYYTAGSGAWVPFVRDLLVLGICRPFFRRTVIHYHSGDLVEFLEKSPIRLWLGKILYGRGAWSIRLGEGCPVPGPEMGAARVIDVPNGTEVPDPLPSRTPSSAFRILFLGNLFEDKGILDVITATDRFAATHGGPVRLSLVGAWPDEGTRARVEQALEGLPDRVTVPSPAPAYGDSKWRILMDADVLVFPSRYRRENVPLVILEAMACGLPVIASSWRGIPSLVDHGRTGFLVPLSDPGAIAEKLVLLAGDADLRARMGGEARKVYLNRHTLEHHLRSVRSVLVEASS